MTNLMYLNVDRIVCSPEFILRKKLSFSDVNICLDRCNNAGVVDKFHVSNPKYHIFRDFILMN